MKNKIKIPVFFTRKYWVENWKTSLINLGIYLAVFTALTLVDLLTKQFIFNNRAMELDVTNHYEVYRSNFIIFHSIFHRGTTISIGLPGWALDFVSVLIILSTLTITLFFKDKNFRWTVAAFAMVAAGAFGNMYDRVTFGGVRDIIHLPWANAGTFNFADAWLVFGGISSLVSIIIVTFWVLPKKNNKESNTKLNLEDFNEVNFESTT
ncbi:signal peptidase II [Mycoplasma phocoeninasale]|uniref:signal peptidase II n=1 Tax=Mycoplasma phocoeninasale TaxID=2726117 RepID=UPI0019685ECC|nr:signal peptidase II [Mycoplasma phocoeninasale]MBN0970703.1 signal peptidase II [Mycoplasma phocoeninasale]